MSYSYFSSYVNYNNFANSNKNNPSIYFYVKNYCFRKMIGLVQQNPNNFTEEQKTIIQNDLKAFKAESQNMNVQPLTKETFSNFMENYYKGINFESKDIQMFRNLIDINEIFSVFGPYDQITKQRSN